MICRFDSCENKNTDKCKSCVRHFPHLDDYYTPYKPTCHFEKIGCIYDPAFARYYQPAWYHERYKDISPNMVPLHRACKGCIELGLPYNYDNTYDK